MERSVFLLGIQKIQNLNPNTRKFIINKDVQFVENEAWEGSVENIISIVAVDSQNDMTNEVIEWQDIPQAILPSTLRHASQLVAQATPPFTTRRTSRNKNYSHIQQNPQGTPSIALL